jgi:dTDP-4-dehydrorhamnose 3,5-epimerase
VPFEFVPAEGLPAVVRVVPRRFADDRGWFSEVYKDSDFAAAGIAGPFLQDNHSVSAIGTIRGLHYQLPPHAQGKLVRVVRGRVWDVAVDIRRSSATWGRWVGAELSAETGEMLWVPPGFAHGFVALEDDTHLTYKCTKEYHQESERAINWDDPDLAIAWPALPPGAEYRLSEKDAAAESFTDAEVFS